MCSVEAKRLPVAIQARVSAFSLTKRLRSRKGAGLSRRSVALIAGPELANHGRRSVRSGRRAHDGGTIARERAREAREMAREQITAKREALRAQVEAKREAARQRRDFLREQGLLRREAIREVERELRRDWGRQD